MKLNRSLQRTILEELQAAYPETQDFQSRTDFTDQNFQANVFYLHELGLIKANVSSEKGSSRKIIWAYISAAGLDFLENDGGLSAILNAVTVKFDVDNLRAILEDQVIASNLPTEQKTSLAQKIKSLSGEGLKSLLLKLMDKAAENPQYLLTLIQNLMT